MNSDALWQQTLRDYNTDEIHLISLEDPNALSLLQTRVGTEIPRFVETLIHVWKQRSDRWDAFVESAATIHPEVMEEQRSPHFLKPLHALLGRVEHGAIGYWLPSYNYPFPRWGYLLQIRSPYAEGEPSHLVLYPPSKEWQEYLGSELYKETFADLGWRDLS